MFLGSTPQKTPLFYSFMNYADFGLGTWYPMGGMNQIVQAMGNLVQELGGRIHAQSEVSQINIEGNEAKGLTVNKKFHASDVILSGADYYFTETLLPRQLRSYSEEFWKSRVMAPSALIYYVGLNKKLKNVLHHSLFFDRDFEAHAKEIYKDPEMAQRTLVLCEHHKRNGLKCCPGRERSVCFFWYRLPWTWRTVIPSETNILKKCSRGLKSILGSL